MPPILGQPRARESSGRRLEESGRIPTVPLAIQLPGTEPGAAGAAGSLKVTLEGRSHQAGPIAQLV